MIKSLKNRGHELAVQQNQLKILGGGAFASGELPTFKDKIEPLGQFPLRPSKIDIFQVNVGYMCNQVCKHCHVDAGPDRKEIMTRETMEQCLDIIEKGEIGTLDLTGGAPEMNPDFRWLVEEANKRGAREIIVRSNLTIIRANKKYYDLPEFFKANNVRIASSLPYYKRDKTDRQRGDGVFSDSIEALKMLNKVGYGVEGSGLILDLVYNPNGAFLPGDQATLEREFKKNLLADFGIVFNSLFCITNIPISRFLDYLLASENYEGYMEELVEAFNPSAVEGVMCKNTISVSYDGYMYDCDFNQMLGLKVEGSGEAHISDFDLDKLHDRNIAISQHCFGCTAGAGSSCQGTVA
jgi:radical SAM/Cys-rich protein